MLIADTLKLDQAFALVSPRRVAQVLRQACPERSEGTAWTPTPLAKRSEKRRPGRTLTGKLSSGRRSAASGFPSTDR